MGAAALAEAAGLGSTLEREQPDRTSKAHTEASRFFMQGPSATRNTQARVRASPSHVEPTVPMRIHKALPLVLLLLPACEKTAPASASASASASAPAPAPAPASASASASVSASVPASLALALQKPPGSSLVDREIEVLERRLEKNPEPLDPWILLGRAWVRKAREAVDPGFFLNASACADIAIGREPKNRPARNLRAMVLLENHAFADALDLAEQILLDDAEDLSALGTKSDASLELGLFDQALTSGQKMVDLKPNLPSYARAAHLRWLQGDSKAAKTIYRSAMDAHDPREPEPYAWVLTQAAMIFWYEGDIEGAEKGFERALSAFPDAPYAMVGQARVALAKGDAKRAAEFATAAYQKMPLCETAWLLGDAKTAMGDAAGAKEAFSWVVKQGRAMDKRCLASFYASTNQEPDEALSLARGESLIRKDIYTRDVLAWALYRKKDFAAAKAESDAALAHGTKEPLLLFHAGAIRLAMGEKAAGEKLLREALKMNPAFDQTAVNEAKTLLGGGAR